MRFRQLLVVIIFLLGVGQAAAQDAEPTPLIINLSPQAPAQVETQDAQSPNFEAPTRTPTPSNAVQLEAREFANVRAEPSTDSAQLGTIRAGEQYNVIGRYVSWIQFQFPSSPNGRGWVYGELVNVTGDLSTLPELDPFSVPAADSASLGVTATLDIITQTPGGILTATAQSNTGAVNAATTPTPSVLPTFTYPPNLVAIAPTEGGLVELEPDAPRAVTPQIDGGIPPIVPILVLGGLGLIGMAISTLRRG